MLLGTLGPLAALYHCNFTTGSVNSRVALYAALLVAGSGFVGRYIYSKIHLGLYGRRTDLKELLSRIEVAAPTAMRAAAFVPELTKRLVEFDRTVLVPPTGLGACFLLPLRVGVASGSSSGSCSLSRAASSVPKRCARSACAATGRVSSASRASTSPVICGKCAASPSSLRTNGCSRCGMSCIGHSSSSSSLRPSFM